MGKGTRKGITMLLAVMLLFVSTLSVSAAEVASNSTIKVSVSHDMEDLESIIATDNASLSTINRGVSLASTIKDLSDGSVGVDWSISAESSIYSQYNYKTNSKKIVLKLKGDKSTSVTIQLYNASGTRVATSTNNIGTIFNTSVTFSNLTASTNYYFRIINNDQHDVSLSGTISQ